MNLEIKTNHKFKIHKQLIIQECEFRNKIDFLKNIQPTKKRLPKSSINEGIKHALLK